MDVETRPHVDNDPDDPDRVDIRCDFRSLSDAVPAMFDMTAAVPLALPVVVQTRPKVGCDPDLPLPVSKGQEGQESLMEDGPDDIVSGQESIIKCSDVRREICVVSDQGPVVVPKLAVVPLALPVVVQTRPKVGCDPDLPLPVSKGQESLMEDGPDDIVSGQESIIKRSDVRQEICVVSDQGPVVVPKLAAVPLAVPVVVQICPCRWTRDWSPSMMMDWT